MKSSPPTRSHSKDRTSSDNKRFINYNRLNPHVSTSPERKEPASAKVKSQIQNVVKKVICNSYAALATLSEKNNPNLAESHEWNGLVKDLQQEEKRLTQETVQSPKSSKLNSKEHSKVFEIITEAQAKTLHVLRDSKYINETNLRLRIQEIFSKLLNNVENRISGNKIDRSPARDLLVDVQQENKELREKSRRMEEYVSLLKLSLQDQAIRTSNEEGLSQRDIHKANELIKSLREDINEKSRYIQDQEFKLRSIRTESDALKQRIFDLEKKILSPNKSKLIREERSPILDEYNRRDRLAEVIKERDELKERIARFSQYPGIYEKQIKKLKEGKQQEKMKLQELIEKTTSPGKYMKKYADQKRGGEIEKKDRDIAELSSTLKELNEEYLKVCNLYREQNEEMENIKAENQKTVNMLNERYQNKCKELEELNKQMEEVYDINQMQKGRNTAIAKDPRARKVQTSKPIQEEGEKTEYAHIIEEKQEEIDRLSKQLACLKRERELQYKENRKLQLDSKVDSEKLIELQKEDGEIRSLLENLYKDLKNLENEKNELLEQLSKRNESNEFNTENENLLKEIENKRKALREFEKREEELFNKYVEEKEKCENLNQDIESYKDELKIAKDAWKQRETRIIEFKQKMKISLEEKGVLEAKINTMETKINELEKELNEAKNENSSKTNQFDLSDALDAKEKKIEELNKENSSLKDELSELKKYYGDLEQESARLYSESAAKDDISLSLQEEINFLNNENSSLKEELSNQDKKHKANVKNLEFQINVLKKYEKMHEESQLKSDQLLKEKQDLLKSFENETIKSNQYINELNKDLENFENICKDKDEEIKAKNDEIIKLKNILQAKEDEDLTYEQSQLELAQLENDYQQKIDILVEKLMKRKKIIKELNEIINSHQKNSDALEDMTKEVSEAHLNEIETLKAEKNKLQLLTERQSVQLDELTSILELGKRQLETERIRNRNAQEELAQLKDTIEEQKEDFQEEMKKLKEGSEELQSAFEIKELRIKSLEEELDIAREDLQEEINSEQEIIEKYEEVEKELKKTKEKLNEILLENENLHKTIESSNETPREFVLEIEKLNKEIKGKSEIIEEMKENIKKSKHSDTDIQSLISQKTQENNHLLEDFEKYKEDSLLKSQEQAEQFGKMLENKNKEINELSSENRKYLVEREILQKNAADWSNQIIALNSQIEAMEINIKDYEKNKENSIDIIHDLKNKIASLSENNEENLSNIEFLRGIINDLKEEIYKKKAQIEDLESQIVELKLQISAKQNEILLQENEIKSLNDILSAGSESDKETLLLSENQRLSSELENIEIKFESIQEVYNSQKSYLLDLQHKFDTLQTSYNNLASELQLKANDLDSERHKSSTLEAENHKFLQNFQKSESLLKEKEIEIQSLKTELEAHTKEFNDGRNKLFGIIDKQNEKINLIENSLQLKDQEFQKLTSENSSLSKQIYDLKDSLSEKLSEIDLKHKTITSLEDSLACLKSQINDSEKSRVSKDNEEPSEILFEVSLSRSKYQQESEFTISKSVEIPFQYTEEDPKIHERSVSVVWPQIEDLEKEIDIKTQEYFLFRLINKDNELEELNTDYEKLEQCMCALERENIKLSQINNLLSNQLKEKISKNDALSSQIKKLKQENKALIIRCESLKKLSNAISKEKTILNEKASELEERISLSIGSDQNDLKSRNSLEFFQTRDSEIKHRQSMEIQTFGIEAISNIQESPSNLSDANINRYSDAEIEHLLAQISQLEGRASNLEKDKIHLSSTNMVISTQLKDKLKQIQSLSSQMNSFREDNEKLESRSQSLKKFADALTKEKQSLQSKISLLENENMSLSRRVSLENESEKYLEEINKLRYSLDSLTNQNQSLEKQLEDSSIKQVIPKHQQTPSFDCSEVMFQAPENTLQNRSSENLYQSRVSNTFTSDASNTLSISKEDSVSVNSPSDTRYKTNEERISSLEKEKIKLSQINLLVTSQLKEKMGKIENLNKELRESEETLRKQESRAANMKKYVDALVKENSVLQVNYEAAEKEILALKEKIPEEENKIDREVEIQKLNEEIETLYESLSAEKQQIEELSSLLQKKSEILYSTQSELENAESKNQILEIKNEKLSHSNNMLVAQMKDKISKNESLSSQVKRLIEENESMRNRISTMKKFIDALAKEKSNVQSRNEELENRVTSSSQRVSLETSLLSRQESTEDYEYLKRSLEDVLIRNKSLEDAIFHSKSIEDELNLHIENLENQVKNLIEDREHLLKTNSETISQTTKELGILKTQLNILENEKSKLTRINSLLKSQLSDKMTKNESLSTKINNYEQENGSLHTRVSSMKKFIDALAREKSSLTARIETLEEENNLLKQKDSEDSKGNQEVDFDLSPMSMSVSQRTSMMSEAFSSAGENEKENLRNELAEMKRKTVALINQNENLTTEIEDVENQISLLYLEKEKLQKDLTDIKDSYNKHIEDIENVIPQQYKVSNILDAIMTMENEIMIKNNDLARYTELIGKIDDELPVNFRKLGILDAVRSLVDLYETSEIKAQICSSPAPHSKTLGAEFNLSSPESTSDTFNIELNPSDIGAMHLSVEEAQQLYATLKKIEDENQEIVEARREQEQENIYLREKLKQTEQAIIGEHEGGQTSLLDLKMLVISLADMIGPQRMEIEACLKEILTILGMTKEEIAQIEERRNKAKGTMEKTSKLKKLFSRSKNR